MFAIQFVSGQTSFGNKIMHPSVVLDHTDANGVQYYKCTNCGMVFRETINGPLVYNDSFAMSYLKTPTCKKNRK